MSMFNKINVALKHYNQIYLFYSRVFKMKLVIILPNIYLTFIYATHENSK
jgi:hypothetical protein